MDTEWPPPSPDDAATADHRRRPNYTARRVGVAAVLVGLVAAVVVWVVGRGGDDASGADDADGGWDVVVLQDPLSGAITVFDADGGLLTEVDTELRGLDDVGAVGVVVVGLEGDPVADGIGLVDLGAGTLTVVEVEGEDVRQLGRAPMLLSSTPRGDVLQLVDPVRGEVVDLLEAAGREGALADVDTVRLAPDRRRLAYTELRSFSTVVVRLDGGQGDGDDEGGEDGGPAAADAVSVPGSLVDLAFDRVLTSTDRGDSVLLDLYDVSGARLGTVETAEPVAAMLVGERSALTVAADGTVSTVDFEDERVTVATELDGQLPVAPGAPTDGTYQLVRAGAALADHTRMVLFGDRFVAFLDERGSLVQSLAVPEPVQPLLPVDETVQCVLVAPSQGGAITYLDAVTGAAITSVTSAVVRGVSADGCTAAIDRRSAADVVVGRGVNQVSARPLTAVSADGSSALQSDADSTTVLFLVEQRTVDLTEGRATGVFARR